MNDAEFEHVARRAVSWVRAEAERVADPDAALAQLMAGESVGLRPEAAEADVSQRRRLGVGLASAAAVMALVVGIVVVGGDRSETPSIGPSVMTADPTADTTPAPTTSGEQSPGTTPPSTTTTTTTPPSTSVAPVGDPDVAATVGGPGGIPFVELRRLLVDGYELAGIERACAIDGSCTQVVFDTTGAPISFDPASGIVTRHLRDGGSFTLPSVDRSTSLVAGGPDEVVYVLQSSNREESNDLVAYSLANGDAGREIGRFATSYGIGDGELIPSPEGFVSAGTGLPGLQPADIGDVVVPWVDRNGNNISSPLPVVRADFAGVTVAIDDRTWTFSDPVDGVASLLAKFTPTFDGGFVGIVYHGASGRTAVVRGWSDGSVDTWEFPTEIGVWADLVAAPTGYVLFPTGTGFVSAELFPVRDGDLWTGSRNFDFEAGVIVYPGLDDYLADADPWWESDPIGFAHAISGRPDLADRLSIEVLSAEAGGAVVQITTENFFDGSSFGSRKVIRLRATPDGYRVDRVEWSQTCQPNRGHQDYQAASCL